MMDYVKAHNLLPAAGVSTAISLVGWWWGGTSVPLPQIALGLTEPVVLQLFVTVLMGPLTVWTFGQTAVLFEQSASRRLLPFDLLAVAALLGPVCLTMAGMYLTGDGQHATEPLRNAALFVGLAFLCLTAFGESAALVIPIGYFMIVATFGGRSNGTTYPWAYVRDEATPEHLVASILVLALGFGFFEARKRRTRRPGRHTPIGVAPAAQTSSRA